MFRRATLALAATGATAAVLTQRPSPADIDQAEANLHTSWAVINRLEDEADEQQLASQGHRKRAAEHQKMVNENKDEPDTPWVEWHRASADGHSLLATATSARRDNLLQLSAEYRRRIAEANCAILQARDARDRGTPMTVAPRVREILRPVLSNH
jgi:methionine-rich copper-binding protein CopC